MGEPIVGIREGVAEKAGGAGGAAAVEPRAREDGEEEDDVEVDAMDAEAASEEGRYARRGNLLKIVEGDEQACLEGFNRACDAGPLAEEPLHGVRVTIIKASGDDSEALAGKVRRRIRQAILRRGARVWEPLVEGDVLCSQNALGKLHGLLSKRRGTIREEDVISNELWCLRAPLPAAAPWASAALLNGRPAARAPVSRRASVARRGPLLGADHRGQARGARRLREASSRRRASRPVNGCGGARPRVRRARPARQGRGPEGNQRIRA